jgi:hypothetical protein
MNTGEEHDHPMNHRLGEEDMNMTGIHMVEVEGMDMVEEHPLNHRLKVEGTDIWRIVIWLISRWLKESTRA